MYLFIPVVVIGIAFGADSDPRTAWRTKPSKDWSQQDANQVLTNSPWSKRVVTVLTRLQSEFERRESGNMGRPHGIGYDDIDKTKPASNNGKGAVFLPPRSKDGMGAMGTVVQVRWETALPVRVAEFITRSVEPPLPDAEGYVVAVYGIPGPALNGDPERLGEPLRKLAVLKREGKKDVRPIRAEVFQTHEGILVAYVFPKSLEVTRQDKFIQFEAQIGRFIIAQPFDVEEMRYDGKLEM